MKTLLFIFLITLGVNNYAQDKMFVHHITSENIIWSYASRIDRPELNGNPNAKLIISQVTFGDMFFVNPDRVGVHYYEGYWHIINEKWTALEPGISYVIYLPDNSHSFTHQVTEATNASVIDETLVNGNADKIIVLTHNHLLENMLVDLNICPLYDNGTWALFSESFEDIPAPSEFFIAADGEAGVDGLRVTATSENLSETGNCIRIDHPALNGNANGKFVHNHVMGNVEILDEILFSWYADDYWRICTESGSEIEFDTQFDLLIDNSHMATQEFDISNVSVYPNPVIDLVNFNSKSIIEKISIHDLSGKIISEFQPNSNQTQINLSHLKPGIYLAKIQNQTKTLKLIKK